SQLSRAISEATGSAPLPLAGRGRADVALSGAPRHLRLSARADFEALHVSEVTLNAVKLDASLADVTRPFEASLDADVKRVTLQERSFDDVHAKVDTRGRELDVELTTKGYAELALLASGTVDEGGEGLQLATLSLRYPEETWSLEAPTHVSLEQGFELQPMA